MLVQPPCTANQRRPGPAFLLTPLAYRYMIQNQTGMTLWYWVQAPTTAAAAGSTPAPVGLCAASVAAQAGLSGMHSKQPLAHGRSEELRVVPVQKQLRLVGPGGTEITKLHTSTINIKFEGIWMPISGGLEVAVASL